MARMCKTGLHQLIHHSGGGAGPERRGGEPVSSLEWGGLCYFLGGEPLFCSAEGLEVGTGAGHAGPWVGVPKPKRIMISFAWGEGPNPLENWSGCAAPSADLP